eukprot:gene4120-14860_t
MADISQLGKKSSLFSMSQRVIESTSQVGHADAPAAQSRRPRTPLENTYKMKPDRKFEVKPVKELIEKVLKEQLEEEKYDARASRQMAKTLSTIITNRVKALKYERYKIVTTVTVGQIADQGVRVASRCLMDQETDQFASGTFKNSSLFGIATVYGFYFE